MSYMSFAKVKPIDADGLDADGNLFVQLPKHADDLTARHIPLKLRMKKLDQLSDVKKKLKGFEEGIVLASISTTVDNKHNEDDDRKKIHALLGKIKMIIDARKTTAKCEIEGCRNQIPIYNNLCDDHLSKDFMDGVPEILVDLMMVRNLLLRVEFLEGQISASLSNHISEKDLKDAIDEVDVLSR